ncbi:MAG: M28 family peptidase [Rhodothermales bacterium]|nr:M28 family peptidase [Rhodothermales bacterium]
MNTLCTACVSRSIVVGLAVIASFSVFACQTSDSLESGLASISAEGLAVNIETLASDAFEGRGPSSPGEEKTITFLADEFESLGLVGGNGDSFYQDVPLVAINTDPATVMMIQGGSVSQRLTYGDDYIAWTKRVVEGAALENSELVFVGYGIVAPEYGWNDYEGLDVAGKTVVILVNDPGYATQDEALFNGNAMTYYGRWTYKYEEAARQGAAGALIIHDTSPAGYPWEVVSGSWSGPQFGLVADDDNLWRCEVEGWLTKDSAERLFSAGGVDLATVSELAMKPGFRSVPLQQRVSISLSNELERSNSKNVMAMLKGSTRPDEYVVFTAHWDHFGRDETLEGDQIYNGAVDNATGTAALLELARAFTAGETPERSVVFLAVTAEEFGLLGSAYYGQNPVLPTSSTVAVINIDALHPIGPARDITVVGYGASELDDYVAQAAAAQNRVVKPDPQPEKGYYYRSDHFSFAKVGVPSLYLDPGTDNIENGEGWAMEQLNDYTANRYHKVSDEYSPDWDLSGMVTDLRLMFRIAHRLANESTFPEWREGNEFRAIREADLAASGME